MRMKKPEEMDNLKSEFFKHLTWSDIQVWAGDTITSRGRRYQSDGSVQNLAFTHEGGLLAWVQGTERYATLVDIEHENLTSACTCPYGGTCKHAVAVVLEYLEKVKKNIQVPIANRNDRRMSLLSRITEDTSADEFADHNSSEDFEDSDDDDADKGDEHRTFDSDYRIGKTNTLQLRTYLEKQDHSQLINLLDTIAERYPEAREFLTDYFHVSSGEAKKLVTSTRKEIDRLSAEQAWSNSWNDEGHIPDYSAVRNRLEMLLSKGYADEVINLGQRLLEVGARQVEESNDEGETGEEISSCLDIVFKALTQSSLSVPDRMLWAIEAELADEYELTAGSSEFWEPKRPAADWNIVADELLQRLNKLRSRNGKVRETAGYQRDRLTDWIILALENAGRREEIIPLCEQEVPETDSYARLVHYLIQANRLNEAEEWIHRGIKATRKSLPGIAIQLRDTLREMREEAGDWLSAAAFRADDFFFRPEVGTFNELRQASKKAGVWPAVRTAVLHYLETGELSEMTGQKAREKNIPLWPLPATGLRESTDARKSDFPLVKALLDIAIEEKRPAEVIRWYDLSRNIQNFWPWSYFNTEDKVAGAVAGAYPERAIAIWKRLAENQISQTKPSAYDQAAVYLNSLRRLLRRMGKEEEWKIYIAELRTSNIRKKRLLAVLDGLSGKPIIET